LNDELHIKSTGLYTHQNLVRKSCQRRMIFSNSLQDKSPAAYPLQREKALRIDQYRDYNRSSSRETFHSEKEALLLT